MNSIPLDGRSTLVRTLRSPILPVRPLISSSTGDDPFWEAVDIWYGATNDLEWYDPQQITTRGGALVITMDSTATTQSGLTPS